MRRWICAILIAALALGLWYIAAVTYDPLYGAMDESTQSAEANISNVENTNTLTLWYTDEALTEYLSSVALSFQQSQGIKVNIVKKSGVEFLENINKVSIQPAQEREEAMPDLYITSHDNLLRAYLAGLAGPVSDSENILNKSNFPETALNAVTCYGQHVAYPLYYETNYLLYNKTYMASIAQSRIEVEEDKAAGEDATKALEEGEKPEEAEEITLEESEDEENEAADDEQQAEKEYDEDPMGDEDAEASEEVLARLATMIPATMEDVTTFANNYDAPDAVESVFKWDVTDIFYNYFFVGNYVAVGGENGDNAAVFNIYNKQAVDCLTAYQGMNQFFTIDSKNDTYDKIIQDFIDGKMVFTVATTDAISKIHEAKKDGKFEFDYGVTTLPDIDSLLKTRGLSVTDAVAINGYSQKSAEANLFAMAMVMFKADELYPKAGKISCNKNVVFEDEEMTHIMDEYEKSVPLPKMIETANYWVQLEIAFTKVWNGADPDEVLKELSDTIGAQIEEIRINLPTQESFTAGAAKFVQ